MWFFTRIKYALVGLLDSFKEDKSFRFQTYLLAIVLLLLNYLLNRQLIMITLNELILLMMSGGLILITELQNSAIETALDRLHPERHDSIKKSKDVAAGAVLVAGGLFFITLLLVCLW